MNTITIRLVPRLVSYYGCCHCQREHNEDDPLFDAHMLCQSRHGIKTFIDRAQLAPRHPNYPSTDYWCKKWGKI